MHVRTEDTVSDVLDAYVDSYIPMKCWPVEVRLMDMAHELNRGHKFQIEEAVRDLIDANEKIKQFRRLQAEETSRRRRTGLEATDDAETTPENDHDI